MLDRDYAIQLAMEYGFTGGFDAEGNLTYDSEFVEAVLEALQREREAIIDLVAMYGGSVDLEAAIRARGEPTSRGEA